MTRSSPSAPLNRLGFYQVPDYGLTPWPDGAMFKGIETFQERSRLKVDGVMAPGEETETWLGKALRGEKRRDFGYLRAGQPGGSPGAPTGRKTCA